MPCRQSHNEKERTIESLHFIGGSHAHGSSLIHGMDGNIEDGPSGDPVGRETARFFYQQAKRSGFKGQSELGWTLFRRRIAKNTHSLGKLLIDVGYHASCISQRIAIHHVIVNQFLISRQILCRSHIRRSKDLTGGADLNLVS